MDAAFAQDDGGMNMDEGLGQAPEDPSETDDAPNLGGPNTGGISDKMEEDADKEKEDEQAIKDGDKPPLEDCGTMDVECWGTNQLIKFVWWFLRAPLMFLEKLITGFEGMGFALPDPSGPLTDKYDQVAEKVRPLVLVGMLLLGALMMVRPAHINSQYLLQVGLPKIGLAVLGLAFFPTLASTISEISNGLAQSFYKDADVTSMFAELLKETFIGEGIAILAVLFTPASWTVVGILALIFLLPVLLLVLAIFVITYLNALFFSLLVLVGPVALACYAVPGLQSITEAWFKGILATAILPVILSIEIMLLSWAGSNPNAMGGGSGGTAALVVAIMLLVLMFKTPGKVYHWAFGAFGGGGGGGFLAGMGLRSMINKGLQVAAGAGIGGAGAAAASGAAGASTGKVIRNAADTYSRNSSSGWGAGRLKQHANAHNSRSALKSIQDEPGAMRGIRDAGKSHVAAESRKEELQAEVLGGKLDPQEAAKQKEAIEAHQAESKQALANNLAQTDGAQQAGRSSDDYANLIDAESQAQEKGQGSQVGGLASQHATDSDVDEAAQQARDTSGSQPTQSPEDELQSYTARIDENEGSSEATAASQTQAGDEQRAQRVSSDAGAGGQSNEDSGEISDEGLKSSQQSAAADNSNSDPGSNSGRVSKGAAAAAASGAAGSKTGSGDANKVGQRHPGDSGYSPPRFTKNKLSDADKEKAKSLNKFIASNPEAKRQYDMALKDDKAQRNKQGTIHHQAMKGSISHQQAKLKAGGHQAHRNQILKGAARDLHSRYHNEVGGNHSGPPVAQSDVERLVGARFDHAYDHPDQHNQMWRSKGHESPSFSRHSSNQGSGTGSSISFAADNESSFDPSDGPNFSDRSHAPQENPSFGPYGGSEDRE
jgi:hypothetical protein